MIQVIEEDTNSPIKKLGSTHCNSSSSYITRVFKNQNSIVLEQGLDREIAEASSTYSFFMTNITNLIGEYAQEDYTDNHMKNSRNICYVDAGTSHQIV